MVSKYRTKKRQSGGRSSNGPPSRPAPRPAPRLNKKERTKNLIARGIKKLGKIFTKKKQRSGPPNKQAPRLELTSPNSTTNVGTNPPRYLQPVAGAVRNDYPLYDAPNPSAHEYVSVEGATKKSSESNQYEIPPTYAAAQTVYELPSKQRNSSKAKEYKLNKRSGKNIVTRRESQNSTGTFVVNKSNTRNSNYDQPYVPLDRLNIIQQHKDICHTNKKNIVDENCYLDINPGNKTVECRPRNEEDKKSQEECSAREINFDENINETLFPTSDDSKNSVTKSMNIEELFINNSNLYDMAMNMDTIGKNQNNLPNPPRLNLNIQEKKELSNLDNNETINIFKEINNKLEGMKNNKDKTVCIAFLKQNLESIVQTVKGEEKVLPIYEFIFINVGNIKRIGKQNINIKTPPEIINFYKRLKNNESVTDVLKELCNIEKTYKLINEIIKFKNKYTLVHRIGKIIDMNMNTETSLGKKRRTMKKKKNKNKRSVKKNRNKRKGTIKKI